MKRSLLILASLAVGFQTSAFAETEIKIGGDARVRWEQIDNADMKKTTDDAAGMTGSRFRLNINAVVNDEVSVFFQPQFTKTWGSPITPKPTSGGLTDTEQHVHQAYMNYKLTEHMKMRIGRQEIAYGDHVLVGNVGWSNVGRAFDAVKVRNSYDFGWADLFMSNLQDTANSSSADRTFSGLYMQFKDMFPYLNEADLYIFYNEDMASENFSTYGTRLKSVGDSYDATLEASFQAGPTDYDGSQIRFEGGYKISGYRIFLGYLTADKNFQELLPTAHKFLGVADLFGRRNITGIRLGGTGSFTDKLSFKLEYLMLSRADDSAPAYELLGQTAIGNGTQEGTALANELDFSLKCQFNEAAYFSVGGAMVSPGDYLKNVRGEDSALFTYIQTGVNF